MSKSVNFPKTLYPIGLLKNCQENTTSINTLPHHSHNYPTEHFIVTSSILSLLYIIDVDECADNTDDCTPHSDCDNSIGGYACLCKQGYVKDGEDCISKFVFSLLVSKLGISYG